MERLKSSNIPTWLGTILIAALIITAYAPSLKGDFVSDDHMVIVRGEMIKSWSNLPQLFTKKYFTSPEDAYKPGPIQGSGEGSYRPMVTLTYFVDYSLWQLNPFGYRLTNLILHIFNSLLVYFLLSVILTHASRFGLIAGALFFALHPVQTETICVAGFRDDLLAFLFTSLSLILYRSFRQRNQGYLYGLSLGSFGLALLSKESSIIFPLLLLAHDHFILEDKITLDNLKKKWGGFILLGCGALLLWKIVVPPLIHPEPINLATILPFTLTVIKILGTYLSWILVPSLVHPTLADPSLIERMASAKVLFSGIVLAILGAIWFDNRKEKLINFAGLWIVLFLMLTCNIFFPIQNMLASRYLYFPMFGFALFVVYGVSLWKPAHLKIARLTLILFFVGTYIFLTRQSAEVWMNGEKYFLKLAEYYPKKAWIHIGLGNTLIVQKHYPEAIEQLQLAILADPKDTRSYEDLGKVYLLLDQKSKAIEAFTQLLQIDPSRDDIRQLVTILSQHLVPR